jgi:sugar lactone lactonase YvrE
MRHTILFGIVLGLAAASVAAGPKKAPEIAAATADEEPFSPAFALAVDKPGGMAFDGALLWVADRLDGALIGVDPVSGAQKARLEAPGPFPTGVAFDGALLWVADRDTGHLFGIDTAKRLVVRELDGPETPLALAFDGTDLWVADGKRLHRVMRADGTTIVSFDAPPWDGKGRASEQLGMTFADGYLWISDRKTNTLYRVEPAGGEVVDTIRAPGPFPSGLAVVGGKLLVADVQSRTVERLDLAALPQIVRRDPKRETVVLRRRITNRGPDLVAEAHVYVAVPVSAPNQALAGDPAFEPAPAEMLTDQWGQRFAHFEARDLKPGESLDVKMTVSATLFAVHTHIDPARVGDLRSIPKAVKDKYLADGAKYDLAHPSIKKHLAAALQGERRPYWMVRKIAAYIGAHMEYEMTGGWNTAPTVIDLGTGSCSEYTFVLIAMCRAAGIPARYAGAIVVRGDDASTDDVFHRWAEVYLPGYGWVPADEQAADKATPEERGAVLGNLDNRFVITTVGGGGSEYMEWDYNSLTRWTCTGRCDVEDSNLGDWYPMGQQGGQTTKAP